MTLQRRLNFICKKKDLIKVDTSQVNNIPDGNQASEIKYS